MFSVKLGLYIYTYVYIPTYISIFVYAACLHTNHHQSVDSKGYIKFHFKMLRRTPLQFHATFNQLLNC